MLKSQKSFKVSGLASLILGMGLILAPSTSWADKFSPMANVKGVETFPDGFARFHLDGGNPYWVDTRTAEGKAALANVLTAKAMGNRLQVWYNDGALMPRFGQSGYDAIIVMAE